MADYPTIFFLHLFPKRIIVHKWRMRYWVGGTSLLLYNKPRHDLKEA